MLSKPKFAPQVYWLVHPLVLALYIFLILLYFVPDYFQKYTIEIIDQKRISGTIFHYQDLNNNGYEEKLWVGSNSGINASIQARNYDETIINQWAFRGHWLMNNKIIFGDFNHNDFSESYCMTIDRDSIFLHIIEMAKPDGIRINNRFISKGGMFHTDKSDVRFVGAKVYDTNHDGYDDYVFVLYGGYSNFPRNVFVYDIYNDTLIRSPESASGLFSSVYFFDFNEDGVEEVCGYSAAHENIHYDMPYTDSSSWVMVFNPADNLDFLFKPIEFKSGIGSVISNVPFSIKGKKYMGSSFFKSASISDTSHYFIRIISPNGKVINQRRLAVKEFGNLLFVNPFNPSENIYLRDERGLVYKTDTSLKFKPKRSNLEFKRLKRPTHYDYFDIDDDGENEVIFLDPSDSNYKIYIYESDMTLATTINIDYKESPQYGRFSLRKTAHKDLPILVYQNEDSAFFFDYLKNPYYHLKYPIYISVYLLIFFIFWGLQKVQLYFAKKSFETEKQLMTQQLALSKKQMEPHFMLNTVNNIGYLFMQEDKKKAMYYLGKFAALMRRGLMNVDKTSTSLEEEIEFVEDYLVLQKQLMDGELDYEILTEGNIEVDKIQLPHSLIYTFTENAIKHGLRPKEKDRKIHLKISNEQNRIKIVIQDNGVGRKRSKELKTTDTGQGMLILKSIIEGYNKLHGGDISYRVEDVLEDSGMVSGTLVEIWV